MKTVFNKKQNLDTTKQPLFFGEDLAVQRYDTMKYPIFDRLCQQQLGFFWRPEEVSLQKDRNDYAQLSESQKFIFTSNLKYQTMLDSVQGRGPCLAFLPFVTNPELEGCIVAWDFMETIHSRSYTYIIKNLYSQPGEVFDTIIQDEKIENCSSNLSQDKQSSEISPGANKKDINEDSSKIRPLNQPKGLFSNIDFSMFAKNRKTEDVGKKNENVIIGPSRKRPTASDFYHQEDTGELKKDSVPSSADEFGPQKPKILKPSISSLSYKVKDIQESDESNEWLEKSDSASKRNSKSKTKKDKKRKSKHKHRKEKKKKDDLNESHKRKKSKKRKLEAKKKRKKHKRHSSTESSSSQSDDRSSRTDSSSDSG